MTLICDYCGKTDPHTKWPGPTHNLKNMWLCCYCTSPNRDIPIREQIRTEAARAYAYPEGMPDILRRVRRSL